MLLLQQQQQPLLLSMPPLLLSLPPLPLPLLSPLLSLPLPLLPLLTQCHEQAGAQASAQVHGCMNANACAGVLVCACGVRWQVRLLMSLGAPHRCLLPPARLWPLAVVTQSPLLSPLLPLQMLSPHAACSLPSLPAACCPLPTTDEHLCSMPDWARA